MKIEKVICDICDYSGDYPDSLGKHAHPELELNGVPVNIWTPLYYLASQDRALHQRNLPGIFRFKDYLPESATIVSLNEGATPLIQLNAGRGYPAVFLKDESHNPTGSFKDRGMPLLINDARASGKNIVAIPSTGNAAVSLVRYAKEAGLEAKVFVPESISQKKAKMLRGCAVKMGDLVSSYEYFFKYCKEHPEVYNGFPVTNVPFYQGIKTMAYEIFIQMNNQVPDIVVMPCGSGVDIVSQYYGFRDLVNMGLADRMPRFVSVQIEGADPITAGFRNPTSDKLLVLENITESRAEAIASDTCFNFFKIMKILKNSSGLALSVRDEDIDQTYSSSLPDLEYSSRSVYAALPHIIERAEKDDKIVLIGTAGGKNE